MSLAVAHADPPVLFIDDDPAALLTASAAARAAGLESVLAPDAEHALRLLEGGLTPALVVTDLELPGIDGLTLARRIRSTSTGRAPLIVVHSSTERPAGNTDADLWLTKSHASGLATALREFADARHARQNGC